MASLTTWMWCKDQDIAALKTLRKFKRVQHVSSFGLTISCPLVVILATLLSISVNSGLRFDSTHVESNVVEMDLAQSMSIAGDIDNSPAISDLSSL
jgi:hypothetical protein